MKPKKKLLVLYFSLLFRLTMKRKLEVSVNTGFFKSFPVRSKKNNPINSETEFYHLTEMYMIHNCKTNLNTVDIPIYATSSIYLKSLEQKTTIINYCVRMNKYNKN